MVPLAKRLEACGLSVVLQPKRQLASETLARWRTTFVVGVSAGAKRSYAWESLGETDALHGRAAIRRYELARINPKSTQFILAENLGLPPVLEVCGILPEYRTLRSIVPNDDLYVIASDWAWSLALTHEESSMGIGPFFAESRDCESADGYIV